jgi:hypothetical protein
MAANMCFQACQHSDKSSEKLVMLLVNMSSSIRQPRYLSPEAGAKAGGFASRRFRRFAGSWSRRGGRPGRRAPDGLLGG